MMFFFVFVGWFRFRVDVLLLPTRWNAKLRRLVNLMQKIKMRWHRSTLQAESFDTKKTWAKISCNKKTHVMTRKKNKTLLGVHSSKGVFFFQRFGRNFRTAESWIRWISTTAGLLFVFFFHKKTPDKMDVSENNGIPKSSHFNRVFRFSIIFTIHLGVFPLFFGSTPKWRGPKIARRCLGLIWW